MYPQWIQTWRETSTGLLHGLDAWLHPAGRRPDPGPETDWLGWDGWVRPARPGGPGNPTFSTGVDDMAQAFLISPESRTIEAIDVDGIDDIKARIGYDTIESDAIGDDGDRLFFDEECFIRGAGGRFQIDRLVPVAGKGVVVGLADDGVKLTDATLDLDELRRRTVFS